MQAKQVRAVYQDKVFKPNGDPSIPEGTEVTLLVLPTEELPPGLLSLLEAPSFDAFRGILKHIKEDSVTLQHKAKEWWR